MVQTNLGFVRLQRQSKINMKTHHERDLTAVIVTLKYLPCWQIMVSASLVYTFHCLPPSRKVLASALQNAPMGKATLLTSQIFIIDCYLYRELLVGPNSFICFASGRVKLWQRTIVQKSILTSICMWSTKFNNKEQYSDTKSALLSRHSVIYILRSVPHSISLIQS